MKYYALIEKKDRGCSIGLMNAILYDEPVADTKGLEYGNKPWYKNNENVNAVNTDIFSEKMYLLSKDRLVSYDIRSKGAGRYFHVISQQFLDILKEFLVDIKEIKPVDVINSKLKNIAEKKYFVVRFGDEIYLDIFNVIENSSSVVFNRYGDSFSIIDPKFKNEIGSHFFKIKNINLSQDPIFCSENFYRAAVKKNIIGVDFLPVEEIDWNSLAIEKNSLAYLVDDTIPLMFIY